MNPNVIRKLEALNKKFYEQHAKAFSNTRTAPWAGWRSVEVPHGASVLDLGCGNGRYLKFLRARGFTGHYRGVDSCSALVHRAAELFPPSERVRWEVARLGPLLQGAAKYDHVAAWGVLHHVPGEKQRAELIEQMLNKTKDGGSLWLSLWQFRDHERFQKNECDPGDFGFVAGDLEDGDALLDWQGNRDVPRYCHHFSGDEIDRLCHRFVSAKPTIHRTNSSDRFNAYLCLQAT